MKPEPHQIRRDALISADGKHRYWLTRSWGADPNGPKMVFVMLNPSTADGSHDDATLRRCMGFAAREGFTRLLVLNLYTYRTESPDVLFSLPEAERNGSDADNVWLIELAAATDPAYGDVVVCGWGSNRKARPRAAEFFDLVRTLCLPLHCLGLTMDCSPSHPLYLPAGSYLHPWSEPFEDAEAAAIEAQRRVEQTRQPWEVRHRDFYHVLPHAAGIHSDQFWFGAPVVFRP